MTRKVWALLCAGAIVIGAASCSAADEPGSDGGKVTISYGIWDKNQKPAMEKIAQEFTKAHPDIQVKVELTPGSKEYWPKLQTAAAGGSAPDVFWMNGPRVGLWASQGALAPLSERIAADRFDTSKFPKSLNDLYTLNGKQYGIPKDYDTIGLWYNKDLFDRAGVKHPDASWTWDDMRAAAKKLTDPAKGVWGIGAPAWPQELYYNTIYQAGGYVISPDGRKSGYDDPATIAGLRLWVDILTADKSSPTIKQTQDTDPIQLFQNGKLAMFWDGSYDAIAYNGTEGLNAGVAPLPAGPKGKATIIHGLANVVYAKSKHPDQAWEFVKFLGSEAANRIQAESGAVIPAYTGLEETWVRSMPKLDLKVFVDQVPDAVPYPRSLNTAAWSAKESELLSQAFSGAKDLDATARELAAFMNDALAKEAQG
ncbi:extracellular solute-binding protein [Actinomadura sp. ATCC 31491]|uniref:Extracellular solute-binding protein n=1 Tax=Actinomadura luzonensis TaxID=2805427 RepID=A0ABT0FMG2_9ACTN|nr:sugar ABC transporter substrate-binding protein [Actinomadura luzonensis]MCK2213536.1 extracellular solute-binding protein [Actinomadura luzonensis]